MARPTRNPAPGSVLEERLAEAARTFAQQILYALGNSSLGDLSLLTGRREMVGPVEPAAPPSKEAKVAKAPKVPTKPTAKMPASNQKRKPKPRISAVRKEAGTKPVVCPAPGCTEPGVRSKMNFCRSHAVSLSELERVRLREAQRTRNDSTTPVPPAQTEPRGVSQKRSKSKQAAESKREGKKRGRSSKSKT